MISPRRLARWIVFRKRPNLVTIRYKSGNKVRFRCEKLTVNRSSSKITELEWKRPLPAPMHFGIDEIESIFEQ